MLRHALLCHSGLLLSSSLGVGGGAAPAAFLLQHSRGLVAKAPAPAAAAPSSAAPAKKKQKKDSQGPAGGRIPSAYTLFVKAESAAVVAQLGSGKGIIKEVAARCVSI
jgi:hypothetical protein